ncbi:MAG TPA: hypothetical protein VLA41_09290 [Burkholderiales bacterium]|nr:hypothetical protein [Burkholderiales bacterium]
MNITVATALLASGILLFWCTLIGTRLAQPPRWTGDTMVMCVIAPAIIFFGVSGAGTLVYLIVKGTWRNMGAGDAVGLAAVLAAASILGLLLAHWSRRAARGAPAEVIAMPRPDSPQPPRPAPRLGKMRKAA